MRSSQVALSIVLSLLLWPVEGCSQDHIIDYDKKLQSWREEYRVHKLSDCFDAASTSRVADCLAGYATSLGKDLSYVLHSTDRRFFRNRLYIEHHPSLGIDRDAIVKLLDSTADSMSHVTCILQVRRGTTLLDLMELLRQDIRPYPINEHGTYVVRILRHHLDLLSKADIILWLTPYPPEWKYDVGYDRTDRVAVRTILADSTTPLLDLRRLECEIHAVSVRTRRLYITANPDQVREIAKLWWVESIRTKKQTFETYR